MKEKVRGSPKSSLSSVDHECLCSMVELSLDWQMSPSLQSCCQYGSKSVSISLFINLYFSRQDIRNKFLFTTMAWQQTRRYNLMTWSGWVMCHSDEVNFQKWTCMRECQHWINFQQNPLKEGAALMSFKMWHHGVYSVTTGHVISSKKYFWFCF